MRDRPRDFGKQLRPTEDHLTSRLSTARREHGAICAELAVDPQIDRFLGCGSIKVPSS